MGRQAMRHWVSAVIVGIMVTLGLGLAPQAGHTAEKGDAGSQLQFGVDMARRGLWNEALFRFKRALVSRPGDPEVLNNIAVAYEALGLFDEALETYKEALAASSGNRDLRANYSRFLEFYQSFKPAEEVAEEEAPAEAESAPEEPAATEGSSR